MIEPFFPESLRDLTPQSFNLVSSPLQWVWKAMTKLGVLLLFQAALYLVGRLCDVECILCSFRKDQRLDGLPPRGDVAEGQVLDQITARLATRQGGEGESHELAVRRNRDGTGVAQVRPQRLPGETTNLRG